MRRTETTKPSRSCRVAISCAMLLAVWAGAPSPAKAWGSCGHRIVGSIAQRSLPPDVAARVDSLLAGESLAEAGLWADEIRNDPSYDWASPYHYVNAPKTAPTVDWQRDCPKRGCVLRGIEDAVELLSSQATKLADRREALLFLIHYVGDIHQPLHVSHADDRGGNSIVVWYRGEETNLHSVWDSRMIDQIRQGALWKSSCERVASKLYQSTDEPADLKIDDLRTTLLAWANESLTLARKNAYVVPRGGQIDSAYFERNRPIVEQRLRLGGARLAQLLEAVLSQ